MDWLNALFGFIGVLLGGGGVLFFRQNKRAKVIENDAKLGAEWEKLYREQKAVREQREAEIERLQDEITANKNEIAEVRTEVERIKPLVCYNFECKERIFNKKNTEK